ncbi:VWA domain-containing protein [Methanococcoides sp. NM1]|uniref:vWA domain-containing protein n=1 Tax=Methanococcoides sp. NM1 TaxID=1201013 RepID=UPI001083294A|nr:VWA domain-containing protein [Methanococcoides sp. NM1]
MPFENTLGLAALASVIPLIILYLLRPKPLQLKIPSLMFLMRAEQKKKRFASLRRLIRDPIFLAQLLVLILLSVAVAAPFYTSEESLSGEHTVFVIDASASMNTDGRFDSATEIAKTYVSKKNSIILAQNIPVTVLEAGGASATKDTLDGLSGKGTVVDLSSSITSAMRMLSNEGGRIIVISDLTNWEGEDPVSAKRLAESYGMKVSFVRVGAPADNVGIIQGWLVAEEYGYTYNCVVKNYKETTQNVNLEIDTSGSETKKSVILEVKPFSTNQFKLTNLGPGVTTLRITKDDSLITDNTAYISIPSDVHNDLLLVTDVKNSPASVALSLLPNIRATQSNNVPADLGDYKVVVIDTQQRALTTEEVTLLDTFINNGGEALFIASSTLDPAVANFDLLKILPVKPIATMQSNNGETLKVVQETRLTEDVRFEDIAVYTYLNATIRSDAVSLVNTDSGIPMLAYWSVGDGTVMYLGLSDELGEDAWNNFHNLPEYPVLWAKLIAWLGGAGDIGDYNVQTGAISALSKEQDVSTPTGTVTTSRLLYDEVGIYEVAGKDIAVNLYDDMESDTTIDSSGVMDRATAQDGSQIVRESTYTSKNYIDIYLIIIAMLLVIVEILIIRSRGEL